MEERKPHRSLLEVHVVLFKFFYFLLFGWWLGLGASLAGYLLCSTIIGLPIGVIILNRLPTIIWLKEPGQESPWDSETREVKEELPLLLRIIWFFLVGLSLGLVVLGLGYILLISLIGAPLGIYLLNRVPLILTLRLHYS